MAASQYQRTAQRFRLGLSCQGTGLRDDGREGFLWEGSGDVRRGKRRFIERADGQAARVVAWAWRGETARDEFGGPPDFGLASVDGPNA